MRKIIIDTDIILLKWAQVAKDEDGNRWFSLRGRIGTYRTVRLEYLSLRRSLVQGAYFLDVNPNATTDVHIY